MRESLAAWQLRVPQMRSDWDDLARSFLQSVSDLASLRMRGAGRIGPAPRRGHAVVHDRLRPGHAHHLPADAALRARAGARRARGAHRAPGPRGQPGRSTPSRARSCTSSGREGGDELVPRLLRDSRRDAALPRPALGGVALDRRLRARARAQGAGARAPSRWIDEYGDRDGDGFVEYERRAPRGLENQSWKDSGDSQRFHDGTLAQTPIAPCEVQGYVYDAKVRTAELAREIWRDRRARRAARAGGGRPQRALQRARSGPTRAAATTCSRSTARSGRSTRSAPTSGTCSGAGSSRASAWTRSSTR